MSFRPTSWNISNSSRRTFVKYCIFFTNPPRKFRFHYTKTRKADTLHEKPRVFVLISRWIVFRMRNVSNFVEKIKTHILRAITYSEKSCRLWDNVEKYNRWYYGAWALHAGHLRLQTHAHNIIDPDRTQMILWRVRISCWTPKATNTRSQYNRSGQDTDDIMLREDFMLDT
jgi:hypothetical protein